MIRRLPTVALGVALCTAAGGVDARSVEIRLNAHEYYPYYADSDREAARPRIERRRSGRTRRHATAARRGRWARGERRRPLARRAFTAVARAGTSRSCLTPAARALLGRIEARFGRVRVASTCRPGATIAGTGRPSRHASGNAIDFHAPRGRKAEVVRWLIANHRSGGTMTYARMRHIHVDIGRRFVSLNSGGG